MHWLSKQPAFGKSREFEITTRSVGRNTLEKTAGDIEEDEEETEQFTHGRKRKTVVFMPCHDTTHTIYYGGHLLRVRSLPLPYGLVAVAYDILQITRSKVCQIVPDFIQCPEFASCSAAPTTELPRRLRSALSLAPTM
jgi:hypothetical protein